MALSDWSRSAWASAGVDMAAFEAPIKEAFGRYMGAFYGQIIGNTQFVAEFAGRGLAKSIAWAPGRMIDQVEDMLTTWRKNDTSGTVDATPYLPVMIVAMEKGFTPSPMDFSRSVADEVDVMIPSDPLQRVFKMRAVAADLRCQVVIMAPDDASAKSLAMQLHLWANQSVNRRFYAKYPLAGLNEPWPVVLETPDLMAVSVPAAEGVKNLTILTVDFQMRATIPLLICPTATEPHDSKGAGTASDPHGYLVVVRAEGKTGPHPEVVMGTWTKGQA
jgi:hypothetical protein